MVQKRLSLQLIPSLAGTGMQAPAMHTPATHGPFNGLGSQLIPSLVGTGMQAPAMHTPATHGSSTALSHAPFSFAGTGLQPITGSHTPTTQRPSNTEQSIGSPPPQIPFEQVVCSVH